MRIRRAALWLALGTALVVAPAAAHEDLAAFDLAAYRGRVVYLDFWASWCAPCRQSFPFMEALRRELGPRGLEVIAVNVDTDRRLAAAFLAETPVGFKVYYDPTGALAEHWHLEGMPTTILVGRDGSVHSRHVGFRRADQQALKNTVARLLAEEAR